MYGFNQETKSESPVSKQFTAGIHSNVELESVTFESPRKDGTGNPSLIFTFKGENGEIFRHIEWEVGEQATDPAKSAENLSKRVKHILTKFIPEDQAVLTGNNYAEFSKGVINLLGDKHKGVKVAIKLLYNQKNNLVFTKYLGFIGKDKTDLRISANESAQLTRVEATPTDVTTEGAIDDLPF